MGEWGECEIFANRARRQAKRAARKSISKSACARHAEAMDTALFDYPLPPERIAQTPAEPRDSARLLVVERATRRVRHHIFRELPELLPPGTRLFRNHAAVFKARLRLRRPTGGELECLLLHPDLTRVGAREVWWCLLKPGKKYPVGATFGSEGVFTATGTRKAGRWPGARAL